MSHNCDIRITKKSLERHLPRDCVIRKKEKKNPTGIHENNSWKKRLFSLKIQINLHRRCHCRSDVIPGIAVKNFEPSEGESESLKSFVSPQCFAGEIEIDGFHSGSQAGDDFFPL